MGDLAELASELDLASQDEQEAMARAALRWLEETNLGWLVILDNVPDVASVEDWVPKRGNGTIIITTRSTEFDRLGADLLTVDTFEPDVAEKFLRDRVRSANPIAAKADLADVVGRLDGLPLALEQAAAWVARVPNRTFAAFVELLDDVTAEPFPAATRPSRYTDTASTTWQVSITAAYKEAPLARRLLEGLAFLAPESLPCEWLVDLADDPYLDSAGPNAVNTGLDALHVYWLARRTAQDTVTVHRVVQDAIRRRAPQAAAEFAIHLLSRQAPMDPADNSHWSTMRDLVPHALALLNTGGEALQRRADEMCWVLNAVAVYQNSRGSPGAAVESASSALTLAESHPSDDHRFILASRNNLAYAFQAMEKYEDAIPLFEANIAQCLRDLGPDHASTLTSRNNLAFALQQSGDLGRAVPLFETNLVGRERVLGSDHPHTLTSQNNLAYALQESGELTEAIRRFEANLARCLRVLGPEHQSTLTSRYHLASAYDAAGNLSSAIHLFEVNLVQREQVLGADHPATISTRDQLACAYEVKGDLRRAIKLFRENLILCRQALEPGHRLTLTSQRRLERQTSAKTKDSRHRSLTQ